MPFTLDWDTVLNAVANNFYLEAAEFESLVFRLLYLGAKLSLANSWFRKEPYYRRPHLQVADLPERVRGRIRGRLVSLEAMQARLARFVAHDCSTERTKLPSDCAKEHPRYEWWS